MRCRAHGARLMPINSAAGAGDKLTGVDCYRCGTVCDRAAFQGNNLVYVTMP